MLIKILTAFISCLFLFINPINSEPAKIKFLVLGFQSRLLNDLEDRLMREELMRELVRSGNDIVSVMELESAVYDEASPVKDFRNIKDKTAVFLTGKYRADYAVSGKIFTGEKGVTGIRSGKIYKCKMRIYSHQKKIFADISFDIPGSEKYYDFALSFSKKCAIEISNKIKEI